MGTRSSTRRLLLALVTTLLIGACGGNPASRTPGLVAIDDAQSAGIATHTYTHGDDCVADFNRDGHLDVLLNAHTDQWKLFYGSANGRFTLARAFPLHDRHGCAAADFNGDGLLDIYFAIGDCKGRICRNSKELWIQRPDHTFENEAAQWGITDPDGRGRVPIVVNANGDNRPDLFTGQETGVDYPSLNRLWINTGHSFVLHQGPPTEELGNNAAAAADLTHDGLDDIAVSTTNKGLFLYRALGGGNYVAANKYFGVSSNGRYAVRFADVNHDGWPDFISVTSDAVQVFLNNHGHFGKASFTLNIDDTRDVAFGDADGDGNLDMYVQRHYDRDQIYMGDGRGNFVPGPIVPKRDGVAESVTVLPHWNNGRDAFIVGNGYENTRGTTQLIVVDGTRTLNP